MADRRKLQGEIERCLKKVTEGVETFEDIWQKCKPCSIDTGLKPLGFLGGQNAYVYSATNANQKEKYEADLKKEIKKLQRLRDQIKTWLTSSDIKDKRSLQEARKIIETQMERFKVVERETKTKAYSKEGLGAAQKLDPAQKERDEITSWLTACIESLNIQLDKFESEIDSINLSLKKKKNDKEKLDRLDDLKIRHGKHKYHINQLEALLRMLDNGTVEVDQIKKIKDDVEYYRDCSEDPDFQENEYLYDDLNLEDLEDYLAKQQAAYQQTQFDLKNALLDDENSAVLSTTPTSTCSNSPSHSPSLENHSSENSTPLPKNSSVPESSPSRNTSEKSPSPVENCVISESNSSVISHTNFHNCQSVINSQSPTSYSSVAPATPNNHYEMSNCHENSSSSNSNEDELNNSVHSKYFHSPSSSVTETINNSSSHVPKSPAINSWTDSSYCYSNEHSSDMKGDHSDQSKSNNSDSHVNSSSDVNKNMQVNNQDSSRSSLNSNVPLSVSSDSVIFDETQSTLKNLAEQAVLSSGINNHIHNVHFCSFQNKESQITHNILRNNSNDLFSESTLSSSCNNSPATGSTEINVAHIFGEIPQNQSSDNSKYMKILEAACKHLPMKMDSHTERHIGGPAKTPDYYNINLSNSNSMEFFQRLSTETLFFIFYFLQGTKAQYFAARALKTKSWRFHTMYMMWFQRHEEPKTITDEYEQGTYIYFDFEKWAQRKKEGFIFEYKYLEDKDLN